MSILKYVKKNRFSNLLYFINCKEFYLNYNFLKQANFSDVNLSLYFLNFIIQNLSLLFIFDKNQIYSMDYIKLIYYFYSYSLKLKLKIIMHME